MAQPAKCFRRPILALAVLAAPLSGYSADPYFAYSERNIEVTAAGTGTYAVNLARSCLRLDGLLTRILGIETAYRAPTYIYALPGKEMKRFTKGDYQSAYNVSRFGNTVLLDTTALKNGRDYYGAYFGYVATLLSGKQGLDAPYWYQIGVPSVFADVYFEGPHARVGGITPAFAFTLRRAGALMPMQTFLSLTHDEVVKKGGFYEELYDAEAWYLARRIYVEGKRRAEFTHYLQLLRSGKPEEAAFAASFAMSHADLDKELAASMRDPAHIYSLDANAGAGDTPAAATPLSTAEVQARLALLTVRYADGPDAVRLASEALRSQGDNETALRALALALLGKGEWTAALAAAERLPPALASAGAYDDRGDVLAALADAAAGGKATLSSDTAALRGRAGRDYLAALSMNRDDARAEQGLAGLASGAP